MKTLITISTYNEIDNLPRMVEALLRLYSDSYHLLIIDDDSPDGTGQWATECAQQHARVQTIVRTGTKGRGLASREAYRFFRESNYDWILEIDADFSHNPSDIKRLVEASTDADIVLGSRFIQGAGFGNYPLHRILLSRFTNAVFRVLLGLKPRDSTQSFMLMSKKVFDTVDPAILKAEGFAIFLELKFHIQRTGLRIVEIPIVIQDRDAGHTKMSVLQAVSVLKLFYDLKVRKSHLA